MMILQSGEARNSEIYDWDRIDEREAIALDTMPFFLFSSRLLCRDMDATAIYIT
jgi:hypothetical protein